MLTWKPATGFHLEALVTRSGPALPAEIKFWQGRLTTRQDRTSVRMRFKHGGRGFAFVTLTDRFDVVAHDRLSCSLPVVRFMSALPEVARHTDHWSGSALIDVGKGVIWPDGVVSTVRLEHLGKPPCETAPVTISESSGRAGLLYETPTLTVRGRADDQRLEVRWWMLKTAYRRTDAWRWARAFHEALSIELGCFLPLLEREVLVFPRQHTERFRAGRLISLVPFQPFEGDLVDRSRLFFLTDFFMKDTREAQICRKLFDQMVRAKRQDRWDDAELILSTALEGALRALEDVRSSDRKWDLGAALARFRGKYLSSEWRLACKRAITAFEHLRHSTAHPDWIVDKMAFTAEAERSASFRDLLFLSRFYGYMILALAGAQDVQPTFGGRLLKRDPPAPTPIPSSSGQPSGSTEVM